MRILRKVSFQQSFAAVIGFAILMMLIGTSIVVREELRKIDLTERDNLVVREALLIDNIAHRTAVERGVTAGFIGSGYTRGQGKVYEMRRQVDKAYQDFKDFVLQEELRTDVSAQILSRHDDIKALRQQIDAGNGASAFIEYSIVNQFMLDMVSQSIFKINQADVAETGLIILRLSFLKERIGQVRGKVNGVLSSDTLSGVDKSLVNGYALQIRQSLELLSLMLKAEGDVDWLSEFKASKQYQTMQTVLKQLERESDTLTDVYPSASDWFTLATSQILKVREHALHKQSTIMKLNEKCKQDAQNSLITTFIMCVFIMSVFVFFGIFVMKALARKVEAVKTVIQNIAKSNDLTVRINDESHDEIGAISRSVDRLVDALTKLIIQVQQANTSSETSVRSLTDFASTLSSRVEEVNTMTSKLQHGVSKISDEIEQIAKSANESSMNTTTASGLSDTTKTIIEQNQSKIAMLSSVIERAHSQSDSLSEKTQNIQVVLDTIASIAEQTNLLALNAAIEAARAGSHGRGFAVVADEVRNLATRSQESTAEISSVLDDIKKQAHQLKVFMQETTAMASTVNQNSEMTLENILTLTQSIQGVNEQTGSVSKAIETQSQLADESSDAGQNITKNMNDVHSDLKNLSELISQLQHAQSKTSLAVNVFKVNPDIHQPNL